MVSGILPWLLTQANVVHQCGPTNLEQLRGAAAVLPAEPAARYLLTGFVGPELPDVLALADVVVSRSGAGTLAKLTALGKAAVLIPLAWSAGGEQAHNARHLAEAGAEVALLGEVSAESLARRARPAARRPWGAVSHGRGRGGARPAGRGRPAGGRPRPPSTLAPDRQPVPAGQPADSG